MLHLNLPKWQWKLQLQSWWQNIKIGPSTQFLHGERHSNLKTNCPAVQFQDVTALHSLETESGSSLCARSRSWARLCPWRWWCLCKSTCSPESEGCGWSPLSPIAGEAHEDSLSKLLLTWNKNVLKLTIKMQMPVCYFSSPGHQAVILINVARKPRLHLLYSQPWMKHQQSTQRVTNTVWNYSISLNINRQSQDAIESRLFCQMYAGSEVWEGPLKTARFPRSISRQVEKPLHFIIHSVGGANIKFEDAETMAHAVATRGIMSDESTPAFRASV